MRSTQSPFTRVLTLRAADRSDSRSRERGLYLQTDAKVVFLCSIYTAVVTNSSQLLLHCAGPVVNGSAGLGLASCSRDRPSLRQLVLLLKCFWTSCCLLLFSSVFWVGVGDDVIL